MTIAVVIPARFESVRFPGKPLAKIAGKPMIEWVVNSALSSKLANKTIVATEDQRIYDFVKELASKGLNVDALITSKDHKCGTDRICEVVKKHPDIKYVVNFQGDEPLMPGSYIDKVIEALKEAESKSPGLAMSSLITPISNLEDLKNPNIVKVVMDKNGFALYFSRSCIPYNRTSPDSLNNPGNKNSIYYRHLGIYGYSREAILRFASLPQSELEIAEQLEQLRMLQNDVKIKLGIVEKAFPAVDVPDDIKLVENVLSLKN